jgi:hypothetical protein
MTNKIICLCGSLRFKGLFEKIEAHFVQENYVVLLPCCMYVDIERKYGVADYKNKVDAIHLRKIDLADEVFIINKDGYIGESTQRELDYAKMQKKVIRFLEPIPIHIGVPGINFTTNSFQIIK